MVPFGHVQRAPYNQSYFGLSLWSPILQRPLHGGPNSARFIVRKLTMAAPHDG